MADIDKSRVSQEAAKVPGAVPMAIDLTSEGMRKAAKLVNAQEANLRRELRQLDAREALAETAPA